MTDLGDRLQGGLPDVEVSPPGVETLRVRSLRRRRRRIVATTSALVCAGGLVVGVAVAAPWRSGPAGRPVSVALGPLAPSATNESLAASYAQGLLGDVSVPGGAARVDSVSAPSLQEPPIDTGVVSPMSAHGLWRTSLTVEELVAFVEAHRPIPLAGTVSGTDQLAGNNLGPNRYEAFQLGSVPPYVYTAWLSESVAAIPGGGSELRADAQVVWRPDRPNDEVAAPDTRTLTIQFTKGARSGTLDIDDPSEIAAVAQTVNSLPTQPSFKFACNGGVVLPSQNLLTSFRISFNAAPTLTMSTTSCGALSVTRDGQPRPDLQETAGLRNQIDQLIAAAATTSPATTATTATPAAPTTTKPTTPATTTPTTNPSMQVAHTTATYLGPIPRTANYPQAGITLIPPSAQNQPSIDWQTAVRNCLTSAGVCDSGTPMRVSLAVASATDGPGQLNNTLVYVIAQVETCSPVGGPGPSPNTGGPTTTATTLPPGPCTTLNFIDAHTGGGREAVSGGDLSDPSK